MVKRRGRTDRSSVVQTVAAAPKATGRFAARPGTFNLNGDFFTLDGVHVDLANENVDPGLARNLVKDGSHVAFESCGCGGGVDGCVPQWPDRHDAREVAAHAGPRFTGRFGAPTWIDVWRGGDEVVVFLHGDIEWGTLLG